MAECIAVKVFQCFFAGDPSVIENADLVNLGIRVLLHQEDDPGHVMII